LFIYVIVFHVEIYLYDNSISYIGYENNFLTIWQFTIVLSYDNNVMTIWNMLIVVKHRESVDVEPNWCQLLKNIRFYTICNNNFNDNLYQLVQDCLKLSRMHRSAKFQTLPNAVYLLWSCEGLWRGLFLCFLGQIVTWQFNPNLLG